MVTETDLHLGDGRTLHVYDTDAGGANTTLVVVWHHGTPNVGAPPEPLFAHATELGIRWVSYDRPGYGGSTRHPGREVASAADDVAAIADALGIARLSMMGHSGGSPHAAACAAKLPERVLAAVCMSGLAPFDAEDLDWFAGMGAAGAAELRAAVEGRSALEDHLASAEFDPEMFTPADHAALEGSWSWVLTVVRPALEGGTEAMVDDDLAYVAPWGFDPAEIQAPVLVVHGGQDRMVPSSHAQWMAGRCRSAELRVSPEDGHVSILASAAVAALDWLREKAG